MISFDELYVTAKALVTAKAQADTPEAAEACYLAEVAFRQQATPEAALELMAQLAEAPALDCFDEIKRLRAENEALKTAGLITLSGCEFDPLDLIGRAVRNVQGPSKYRNKWGTVRWALVRDAFGVGSGVATALCRRFDLDPEEALRS